MRRATSRRPARRGRRTSPRGSIAPSRTTARRSHSSAGRPPPANGTPRVRPTPLGTGGSTGGRLRRRVCRAQTPPAGGWSCRGRIECSPSRGRCAPPSWPGTYLRNTRSRTDCNPEAKGVCTSHRSSHSEWLRQARTRSTRSGPCYCAHCSHMLGNHFLLMWARLSRGLAHISSVAACIQTPAVCVRPPTDVWSLRGTHSLARRGYPLPWLVSTRRPFHSKWNRAVRRPSV